MQCASPIQKGSKLAELLEKYHTSNHITRQDRETLITLLDKEIREGNHDAEDKLIMALLHAVLLVNLV
jgi:hypothetical protein